MNLWQAIVLGVVEGITEFLPVSSTGHLILAGRLLNLPSSEFLKTFDIAIQSGAVIAVLVLYGRSFLVGTRVLSRVAVATLPAFAFGLLFYKFIKKSLLANPSVVIASLVAGGFFLILFECRYHGGKRANGSLSEISLRECFLIGCIQSLAMIPGVSRSAAAIVGGLALGLERKTAVEFSFLLAVPTLLGATVLDLAKTSVAFTGSEVGLLAAGLIASFVTAILAIEFLLGFLKNHSLIPFGVYRIFAAGLFWLLVR